MENSELNYVKISTEDYNHLRDFKTAIDNGLTVEINRYDGIGDAYVYTKDEFSKGALEDLEKAHNEISHLNKKLNKALHPNPKETTAGDIKKLSLWGFWKWKWL